jgi:hypothetical protein
MKYILCVKSLSCGVAHDDISILYFLTAYSKCIKKNPYNEGDPLGIGKVI